jgi:hypothetical protein
VFYVVSRGIAQRSARRRQQTQPAKQ